MSLAYTLMMWFLAFVGTLLITGVPAAMTWGVMFGLTRPIVWLYKEAYWFNWRVDAVLRNPKWREPVAWGLMSVPALAVGWIFCTGPAFDFVKSVTTPSVVEQKAPVENLGSSIRRYELVDFIEPKNYYVSLRDAQEKSLVYNNLRVRTNCDEYRNHKVGDHFNLKVTRYRQGEREWIEFDDLGTLCAK